VSDKWLNKCAFGDVRAVLKEMIADGLRVNCIVCSPPYWGLRSYLPPDHADKPFELGAEPTLREFITNMAEVFMLAREVLADDGTCWINMGDCYATGAGKVNTAPGGGTQGERWAGARNGHEGKHEGYQGIGPLTQPNRMPQAGLKPKDLAGQPWRLAFALQDAGWWLRQDIIWSKPNPMPESTRDRCTKAHEYIFLMSKSERYYWNFEAFQEPASGGAHARRAGPNAMRGQGQNRPEGGGRANREGRDISRAGWKTPDGWDTRTGEGGHGSFHAEGREKGRKLADPGSGTKNNTSMDEALAVMPLTRNPRSVWTTPTQSYKGSHFATFPEALVERCLIPGCPPGGTVLDIFMGSGTTGQVAQRMGMNWIGIDIDERNAALQADRIGGQAAFTLEAA